MGDEGDYYTIGVMFHFILHHKVQNAPSGALPDMGTVLRTGKGVVSIFPQIL